MDNSNRMLRTPFLHANGPHSTLRLNRDKPASEAQVTNSISSLTLFGNSNEISIQHCGSDYRLRITRQDKLILTK